MGAMEASIVLGNLQRWHTQLSPCESPLPRQRQSPAQLLSALPVPSQNTQHSQGTPGHPCHGEVSKHFHFPLSRGFPACWRILAVLAVCCSLFSSVPSQHGADTGLTHPLPHLSTSHTPSTPTAQQVPFQRQANPFLTACGTFVSPGKAKPTSKFGNVSRDRAKEHLSHTEQW